MTSQRPWTRATIDSPVGRISLVGDAGALRRITLHASDEAIPTGPHTGVIDYAGPAAELPEALAEAAAQLGEYFSGERREFTVPILLDGTAFQHQVWNALAEVPYGATISYQGLAEAAGHPTAVRAVAGAVASNPLPIVHPCHRVLPSSGLLGNYSAGDGPETKWALLAREGVTLPR